MTTALPYATQTNWMLTVTALEMCVMALPAVVALSAVFPSLNVKRLVEDVEARRLGQKIKNIKRLINKLLKGRGQKWPLPF